MAFGIAGLSRAWPTPCPPSSTPRSSPSGTKTGLVTDFEIEGDFPKFGNNDDRVDEIACEQVGKVLPTLCASTACTASAKHTLSILTITSNVVYGKKTGTTPDGRKARRALGPRRQPHARPGHQRRAGLAELRGQAPLRRLPGRHLQHLLHHPPGPGQDGDASAMDNLVTILDRLLCPETRHHLNVNVLNRETLHRRLWSIPRSTPA